MNEHDIKTEILTFLLRSQPARYSEIKPTYIENDLFNYHLQHLVKKGLVAKGDGVYFLTEEGKRFVEVVTPIDPVGNISELFRVNILGIVADASDPKNIKILNQERKRHPYFGDKGIIGGTVRPMEPVTYAAARKVLEETGISAEFEMIGTIRKIRLNKGGDLFSDIFYYICYSESFSGNLIEENEFGVNYWASIEQTCENEKGSVQGSEYLADLILGFKKPEVSLRGDVFYVEETKTIDRF
ncbi:NUDIX domain-containing protein [candidate division WWE3 bacterium]|uniref:NUDIX domain-containing protein n=1 Tax=candidate division WWE3 bacterium TaxID=2053526 RepID=A0A955RSB8_UNCKA|nr:NUDIX domain-containing protein [candidate division WWE3 bacterium]